jgi:predicted amidohydrolase
MYKPVKWDKDVNMRQLEKAIREARRQGAELIVTPEGALEGYVVNQVIRASGQTKQQLTKRFNDLAEPCNGPYIRYFKKLSKELSVYLVLAFLEADRGKTFNTAILLDPNGAIAGKYRKTHFAQGYSAGEKQGDNPVGYSRGTKYPVFNVGSSKIGIMICFDRRVPEVAGRLMRNGADFIINPAYGMKGDCNRRFISARAKENNVPVLFVHPEQTVFSDEHGEIKSDIRPGADANRMAIIPVDMLGDNPEASAKK